MTIAVVGPARRYGRPLYPRASCLPGAMWYGIQACSRGGPETNGWANRWDGTEMNRPIAAMTLKVCRKETL